MFGWVCAGYWKILAPRIRRILRIFDFSNIHSEEFEPQMNRIDADEDDYDRDEVTWQMSPKGEDGKPRNTRKTRKIERFHEDESDLNHPSFHLRGSCSSVVVFSVGGRARGIRRG
jgi:hypothetical protein